MATASAYHRHLMPARVQQNPFRPRVGHRLTTYEYQQPRQPYNNNQGYMPNGAPGAHTNLPLQATPLLPNQGRVIQTGPIRILCIADVRGMSTSLPRASPHRPGVSLVLYVLVTDYVAKET